MASETELKSQAATQPTSFSSAITNGRLLIESFVSHDGNDLRYGKLVNPNRAATDKALLFVPGLGGTVKSALHFLNILLPYYSCIYVPDLRGYGLNQDDAPLHSLTPIIGDLEVFHRDVIGEHQALDLCGISLGGVLATLLSTKYRFYSKGYQKLVLLVPAFKASPVKFTLAHLLKSVSRRIFLGKKLTRLPYSIETLTQNPDVLNHPEFQDLEPLTLSIDYLLHVRSLGIEAQKRLPRLNLPTLVAVADKDYVCDPATIRKAYNRLPATLEKKLLEYPELYHDILLEKEVPQIAQTVADWLNT